MSSNDSKKVQVVMSLGYEPRVVGVYSSKKLAAEAKKQLWDQDDLPSVVYAFEMDELPEPIRYDYWFIPIDSTGEVPEKPPYGREQIYRASTQAFTECRMMYADRYCYCVGPYKDQDQAIVAAKEAFNWDNSQGNLPHK